MPERKCSKCNGLFLAIGRQRVCPDCKGETHVRDCVDQMRLSANYRLATGLRMLDRGE